MKTTTCALVTLVAVGGLTTLPAAAATKPKPITKTYAMQLAPVPNPPMGTSCLDSKLEGVAMHTETVAAKGKGTLTVKVTGFSGDWDITVVDAKSNAVLGVGGGTTTGGGAPATKGTDTAVVKVARATTFKVRTCNFAGTPQATGSYAFTYA